MNKDEFIKWIVSKTTGVPAYRVSVVDTFEMRRQIRKIEFRVSGYTSTCQVWYDKKHKRFVHNLDAFKACCYGLNDSEYISENYYKYL